MHSTNTLEHAPIFFKGMVNEHVCMYHSIQISTRANLRFCKMMCILRTSSTCTNEIINVANWGGEFTPPLLGNSLVTNQKHKYFTQGLTVSPSPIVGVMNMYLGNLTLHKGMKNLNEHFYLSTHFLWYMNLESTSSAR